MTHLPLSIDISFLFPGLAPRHEGGGLEGGGCAVFGMGVATFHNSNVVRGPFPSSLDVSEPSDNRGAFNLESPTDDAALSRNEQGEGISHG